MGSPHPLSRAHRDHEPKMRNRLEIKQRIFRFMESEGDDAAASGTTGFSSTGGDHDKLAAIDHVGAGSCIASER